MPIIRVDYDDEIVRDREIGDLALALKDIVVEATGIPETSVFASSPKIKVNIAPIEVFIEMSAEKIKDLDGLFEDVKKRLVAWKKEQAFPHPITITLTPMHWKFDVDIH